MPTSPDPDADLDADAAANRAAESGVPAYLAPYREAVAAHGAGFSATLWGSETTQRLRFDVFDALVPLDGLRIVDLGCGQGDLPVHLAERGIELAGYVGVDAMPEMVERATDRGLPGTRFVCRDLLTPGGLDGLEGDVVCISGALNTMEEAVARDLVGRAFDLATLAVVFNFLGDRPHERWAGRDLTPARRFSILDWFDWATARTSRVRLDQSYLDGHDVTLAMLHDGDASGA